jgi:hypothetical protein
MAEPAGVEGWIELFRSLGAALLEVLHAEAQALGEDFRRSGSRLARGAVLLGGAAAVGFWTVGALVLTLMAVLAIWLRPWAAALIVTALFAASAGLLAVLGLRQLRQFESPAESIRRRVSDHLDWWRHRLLAEPALSPTSESGRLAAAAPVSAAARPGAPATPGTLAAPGGGPPRIHPDDPLEEDEL